MLPFFSAGVGAYLIWRYVCRLTLPTATKTALSVVLLVLIEHHWLVGRFFGTVASPEVPRTVIMFCGFAFGTLLLFACLMALRDLLGAGVWLFLRQTGRRILTAKAAGHAMLVLSTVLSGYGVWQAVRVPDVRSIEVALPGLDPALDGYRLVHLTDLHTSRLLHGAWLSDVVDRANALQPDLIVISGDMVDGTLQARAADYPFLGKLAAKDGVYGVPGNHEYYAEYRNWMDAFRGLGLQMLVNEHVVVTRGQAGFVLAGVSDMVGLRFGEVGPDIQKALMGRPANLPVVLLDHRPGNAVVNQAAGVDLQFSGHTHGGHIRGIDLIVKAFNAGFVSGRYDVGDMVLYVSNGAGLWPGFPLRVGRASEITEVILRAGPAS